MANEGTFDCGFIDVRGRPMSDPEVNVAFFNGHGKGRPVFRANDLRFVPRRKFRLPAFPQSEFLHGDVAPSRFRPRTIGAFRLTAGEVVPRNLTVLRDPSSWRASFVRWRDLGMGFRRLKEVLGESTRIGVRGGPTFEGFVERAYDDVTEAVTVHAKASLLNLYSKLTALRPSGWEDDWFSGVRRILTLGRERFIAIVEPRFADVVREIKNDIKKHELYKHTPAGNHFPNFPSKFHPLKSKMYSIKSRESQGNLQITIAPGRDPDSGQEVFLADIDIDENGELLRHLLDVFLVHRFTGGTHPFDIHEYLLIVHREATLGYRLV